jgi:hypothetical protein
MFRTMSKVEVEIFERGIDEWWAGLGPTLKSDIRQLVSSVRAKRFDKEKVGDLSLHMPMPGSKWDEAL